MAKYRATAEGFMFGQMIYPGDEFSHPDANLKGSWFESVGGPAKAPAPQAAKGSVRKAEGAPAPSDPYKRGMEDLQKQEALADARASDQAVI